MLSLLKHVPPSLVGVIGFFSRFDMLSVMLW